MIALLTLSLATYGQDISSQHSQTNGLGAAKIKQLPPNKGEVTTPIGAVGRQFNIDGTGSAARFNYPTGVAVDAAGTVYVADQGNNTIRKISPAGVVTTLAEISTPDSIGGPGVNTRLSFPTGLAVDATGTIYMADPHNHVINKITPAGVVTILAGQARAPALKSISSTPNASYLFYPMGVASGANGAVYVVDMHTVYRIGPDGNTTTIAGGPRDMGGTSYIGGSDDGMMAGFSQPAGVGVDAAGMVYVADTENHLIRKITPNGKTTTLAGKPGYWASNDGAHQAARFQNPTGVAVDAAGTLYIADRDNHTIRKITPDGRVTTLAGKAGSPGSTDGPGRMARFNKPTGVAVDAGGNVYVADCLNHTIRKIRPDGTVTTLAGLAGSNDTAQNARLAAPEGIAVDAMGTLYIADSFTHTIRKITKAGVASTLAGQPNKPGYANGPGAAALFEEPKGIAVDASGTVYVADQFNRAIRKITPAGIVTTLADTTKLQTAAGIDSVIHFFIPTGMAVNATGTVYVADESGVIYRISPMGVISVLAGKIGKRGSTDGSGSAARFNQPGGLAVDKGGNVYVADSFNRTIRKITPAGTVTTLAGLGGDGNAPRTEWGGSENDPTGGTLGSTDGPGAIARFGYPTGVAVDAAGTVYVADIGNHTIRVISPTGIVSTLAGKTEHEGSTNGTGSTARFNRPTGIAVDAAGTVYVADEENGIIRVIR